MIDSKILLSVVIVILIGAVAAGYQISSQNPGLWQPLTSQNTGNSQQTSSNTGSNSGSTVNSASGSSSSQGQSTGGASVQISSSQAKSIATKYIEEPGATAGTPKLITLNGQKVYLVPVIMNGQQVGEIYIDPDTGANRGGSGGVK
jgi:cytoskeletal protein RodZ